MRLKASLVLAVAMSTASPAWAVVLYSGSGTQTPDLQGWLYLTLPLVGASASQSAAGGVTTLNTTLVRGERAGYFSEFLLSKHSLMPVLDRTAGYVVRFTLGVVSEGHNPVDHNGDQVADRGGFSVIALSSDLHGIEIAFWGDEAWAYDYADLGGGTYGFVHAEGTSGFAPPSTLTNYALTVSGGGYSLAAGGPPILTGPLRNYSAEGPPYNTPSFLFFGDDTASADSETRLSFIEVIPEPAMLSLAALGGLALAARRPRR